MSNASYKRIQSYGSAGAFVPNTISKAVSNPTGSTYRTLVFTTGNGLTTAPAAVVNLGNLAGVQAIVSATFSIGGEVITSAGVPTFDFGLAADATTAATQLGTAVTMANVNANVAGVPFPIPPLPAGVPFLNFRVNAAALTAGSVRVSLFCLMDN